jgi:branched-chain amino acid transport system substrate-binding protein
VLNWKAKTYVAVVASSVAAVLQPAGLETAQGLTSGAYLKDADDPKWTNDSGFKEYSAWMDKYFPGVSKSDNLYVSGYTGAQIIVKVLEKCGNDLSRNNILEQARHLDLELPMLLPGIHFTISPDNYRPIRKIRLQVFKDDRWVLADE